ncbi:copper amine oxidase N-terminal domain-containing protein [Paenibacillus glycinis]|uniref:Copper amine oxidase-like N-terminal domain-containing protein n=1 Tax=Paenibacillus glycinis TaxID=2697035 RepID=A0ABW9XRN3_9BACL|nr:copper amine oxidase N-terminal domain-containing protein [Paenibacillus glycinis]NBD25309.1 hypothetical protein [Paenibacillus glycinis]
MKLQSLIAAGLTVLTTFGIGGAPAGATAAIPLAHTVSATPAATDAESDEAAVPAAPALPSGGIAAADIAQVHFQQADELFVPLFRSREADSAAIAKTAAVVNRLIGKAELTKERLDGDQHFFAMSADIQLDGGMDVSLEFMDKQNVLLYYGPDVYLATDGMAMDELKKLMILPPRTTINTLRPAIGSMVAIKGSDGYGQSGIVNVFVETAGSSGGYSTPKGTYFPSKRALLVYSAPLSEARYDFHFVMPAYGEAIDGTFKPIAPGQYDLDLISDTGGPTFDIDVAVPASPQLAINGVPVASPALKPIMQNGVMLLPMRALAEAFAWNVTWDAAHKAAMMTSLPKTPAVHLDGGSSLAIWVDGKRLTGENAAPVIVKGSVYLPLRATAQAFGFQLTWTPSVNSALLAFEPRLLDENEYAGDAKKLAAAKLINDYVGALNGRDGAALEKLFAKESVPSPPFGAIGQRLITGIRSVTFQDRPGGALLANTTFSYLFDPSGNRTGGAGIVLTQENGSWKIADVD